MNLLIKYPALFSIVLFLSCNSVYPQKLLVGDSIQGNWGIDSQLIYAKMVQTKSRVGNPVDGGVPAEWAIMFSSKEMKQLNIGCCKAVLINEGDLNSDGIEEMSVFQTPSNGCTYSFYTYSFKNGVWEIVIGPLIIPNACDALTEKELQARVVTEGSKVVIYENDLNDENFKLIKKEVMLK